MVGTSMVVLGSANLDLVYRVNRIPEPGETVLASGAAQHPGGKGNNQVIAAARAGANASFIAAFGADGAAELLLETLGRAGVTVLAREVEAETGTALITVDDEAENTIVVNSGANALLLELTAPEREAIAAASLLLMQLEIPIETIVEGAQAAAASGTAVILNAAPARALPDELIGLIDVLIVNEHEALVVAASLDDSVRLPAAVTLESAPQAAAALLAAAKAVVVTLGGDGAVVVDATGAVNVPAPSVVAVDTTGAGDTLCGVLTAGLAEGMTLVAATRFAVQAAAISVQRHGAVPSIPSREEIDAFQARASNR